MRQNDTHTYIDWYDMKSRINHIFLLHEEGKYDQVVTSLLELPKSVLEQPKPAYLLGSALASLGRKEEACEAFDHARLESEEGSYWQSCRMMKAALQFGF